MKTCRKTAVIVGVLFIIGTLSGILSTIFTVSILRAPDFLSQVAANETKMLAGAFCVLIMGLSLAMVPVMMYPLFRKHNETLALGALVFRGPLEAGIYILTVASWLLLIVVSRESASADTAGIQALGSVLQQTSTVINPVLEIVFSLGAVMFYILFYQTKFIPRWLSVWGIIGAIIYLAAGVLAFFGIDLAFLIILLALQEMVMAFWLIFKGFD